MSMWKGLGAVKFTKRTYRVAIHRAFEKENEIFGHGNFRDREHEDQWFKQLDLLRALLERKVREGKA